MTTSTLWLVHVHYSACMAGFAIEIICYGARRPVLREAILKQGNLF